MRPSRKRDRPGGSSSPKSGKRDRRGGSSSPGSGERDQPGGSSSPESGERDQPGGSSSPESGKRDQPGGSSSSESGERDQPGGSSSSESESESEPDTKEYVAWVRDLALDPTDPSKVDEDREEQILSVRSALYLDLEGVFPNSSRKKNKNVYLHLEEIVGQVPTRRSKRISKNNKFLKAHPAGQRKRVPRGPNFQADVPHWTEPPSEIDFCYYMEDVSTSRWLGTCVWPAGGDVTETNEAVAVKGMPDGCDCASPRSTSCVKFHISVARDQLKSELGQAFSSWGFDAMGEEVPELLSRYEQKRFNSLKQLNPQSKGKTFWSVVSKYFTSKNIKKLVSYYYNVYLPRRMGYLSRSIRTKVNSDEDSSEEKDEESYDDEDKVKYVEGLEASSSKPSRSFSKAKRKSL